MMLSMSCMSVLMHRIHFKLHQEPPSREAPRITPQTDGQTEVVNRSIETYLRCFVSDVPRQWSKWLPWAEYWYNTSYHTSSHTTPFKVLYGRDPPRLVYHSEASTPSFEVDCYLEEPNVVLEELKRHLLRAQQLMKKRADCSRRDIQFKVGDMVFLKLRPYRQMSVAKRRNEKLAPRYYGPFEILDKVGQVAYKVKLPESSSIHHVFHVSQLKKIVRDQKVEAVLPDCRNEEPEVMIEPVQVLEVHTGEEANKESWKVLIRWKGLPEHETTWESFEGMVKQFPDFHLEDKVKLLGRGNDKIQIHDPDPRFGLSYHTRTRVAESKSRN